MITIRTTIPDAPLRNSRIPVDGDLAPRCRTGWMLMMNSGGEVSILDRDYYGGDGTPMDEWHNRTLTWDIRAPGDGSVIDREGLAEDLAEGGKLRALLDRVHAGHSVDWDGSNYRGYLDDDARDASDEVERLLADYPVDEDAPEQWDAYTWLTGGGSHKPATVLRDLGITPENAEAEIEAGIAKAREIARADNVELVNADDAIEEILREAREAGE